MTQPEWRIRGWQNSAETRRKKVEPKYQEMVRLRMKEGLSNGEIARRMGLPTHQVWHFLGRTPVRLGGAHDWRPEMQSRVRYLRECGYRVVEISEQTGVPTSTVSDWIRGMPCD